MKFLIGAIALIFSMQTQAFFERKLGAMVISNPIGASLSAGLAYNYKVWSDSDVNFWKYGYIRPKVNYDTSYAINTFSGEIQLFPISLLGVSFGSFHAYRNVKELWSFNCDTYNCAGQLRRNFYRINLNLGYKDYVTSIAFTKDYLYTSDAYLPFVDYSSMLLIEGPSSEQDRLLAFFGYKLSEKLNVGVIEMYSQIHNKSGSNKSEAQFLAVNAKADDMNWVVGMGTFGSDYHEKFFSLLVKVSWSIDPTLSLND